MKQIKKLFIYKSKIILTNGSSLNITSIKYIKNYQNLSNTFKKNTKQTSIESSNSNTFVQKIKN